MWKKLSIGILLLFSLLDNRAYAEKYINNLSNAKRISQKEDKPILLIFSMENCPHCDTLKDEIKNRSIKDFVICILKTESNIPLMREYNIALFPTSVILEPKLFRHSEDDRFVGYSADYWKWLDSSKK